MTDTLTQRASRTHLIVVDNLKDWPSVPDGPLVITARDYLTDPHYAELKNARVFNFCRSYRYQSVGYYVSLLALARSHPVIPSIKTIQDMKSIVIVKTLSDELDKLIQKKLSKILSRQFVLTVYFGHHLSQKYEELAKEIYGLFPAPFLRATFVFKKKWLVQDISPIPVHELNPSHRANIMSYAEEFFSKKRFYEKKRVSSIYDLAILVDPEDPIPPSNKGAIQRFINSAESIGFSTELITKDDFHRLSEFDALLIRDTTAVNHYTYRFSRRAHAEGLVVMDDPDSIVKCTNKVYLAELLGKLKIPTPKTMIIHRENKDLVEGILGLPCVLKQPDSSFSQGVIKVCDRESLKAEIEKFLSTSELIVGQEYIRTDFDWRIGVLNQEPLFACKYFMAKNHWQIYNWGKNNKIRTGDFETLDIQDAPELVVKTAVKACNAIGNGFYGVDLKEIDGKAYVIEVNDNPTVDAGIEDKVLKDQLYQKIMHVILERIPKSPHG